MLVRGNAVVDFADRRKRIVGTPFRNSRIEIVARHPARSSIVPVDLLCFGECFWWSIRAWTGIRSKLGVENLWEIGCFIDGGRASRPARASRHEGLTATAVLLPKYLSCQGCCE